MAKSVSVSVYVAGATTASQHLEPHWWPADKLRHDARFKRSNDTGSCNDWTATLSEDEFRQMHEELRPLATTGLYGRDGWRPRVQPQLQQLDASLNGAPGTIGHVEVKVFEWESGL